RPRHHRRSEDRNRGLRRRRPGLAGMYAARAPGEVLDHPATARDRAAQAAAVAEALEDAPAEEIVRWALESFGPSVAIACSFGGPSGMAILDMAVAIDPSVTVTYLDTGLL